MLPTTPSVTAGPSHLLLLLQVIWRGSTTDTKYNAFDASNYQQATRIRLHKMFGPQSTTPFDVALHAVISASECHISISIDHLQHGIIRSTPLP